MNGDDNDGFERIYLIKGKTGMYEQECAWTLRAFWHKESAKFYLLRLNGYLTSKGIGLKGEQFSNHKQPENFDECPDPFLKMCLGNTGVTYEIEELDLYD